MFLSQFHQENDDGIHVSAEQASRFAKEIAGDFNPIHNPDAKRFCVPGDLLFSLVLGKYGLSQKMCFTFSGMVGRGVALRFPQTDDAQFAIVDDNEKDYLKVERHGDVTSDVSKVEPFIRQYVAFSGHNFPHILVPLMAEHNVMINPSRPLVVYESMSIDLISLDFTDPVLEASDVTLDVNGKRGDARLEFDVLSGGEKIGKGFKKLVLSGLREYDEAAMQGVIDGYLEDMRRFQAA